MNRHERRLQELMVIAEDMSDFKKTKHAAAIYTGNRLVAVGVNQLKTHPLQARFGRNIDAVFLHAEIDAIRNALKRLSLEDLQHTTLYIARSKDGRPKNSKPCKGCQRAIMHFGIGHVYWTGDDQLIA